MSSSSDKKKKQKQENWIKSYHFNWAISVFILPVIMWVWPDAVPFSFFHLWTIHGSVGEWVAVSWPIFAWGIGVNLIHRLFNNSSNADPLEVLMVGFVRSVWAGTTEELSCRWLFFMLGIITAKVSNFFLFGFLGFGIPSWIHNEVMGPIVNFTTFGYLEHYIFFPGSWAVGASMLATNAFFRDGHRYQGFFGWVNSWCAGMFLFWIMFRYGLPAAIFVHFSYNFLIYATSACAVLVRGKSRVTVY